MGEVVKYKLKKSMMCGDGIEVNFIDELYKLPPGELCVDTVWMLSRDPFYLGVMLKDLMRRGWKIVSHYEDDIEKLAEWLVTSVGHLRRLRVAHMPKLSEEAVREMIELAKNGTPVRELAKRYGVTEAAVRYHLRKAGIFGKR